MRTALALLVAALTGISISLALAQPLSAVAVLTIHVRDTNTHAAVFNYLKDVLQLPVEYYPETVGERRYAGVYAGNMYIEPCGPFTNMAYPLKEFRALFYGLNCTSEESAASVAESLRRLNFGFEEAGSGTVRILEPLVAEGIYLAISSGPPKPSDQAQEAALKSKLTANRTNGVGIECLKEIWLGHTGPDDLRAWANLLGDSRRANDAIWRLGKDQNIRLVKSEVRGVRRVAFKVRSMEQAEQYLKKGKCGHRRSGDGQIELDQAETAGLPIYLTAE